MRTIFTVIVLVGGIAIGYFLGTGSLPEFSMPNVSEIVGSVETIKEAASNTTQERDPKDIRGLWQSKDDTKFSREFKSGGIVIDRYKDDASATSEGTWELFQSPTTEETPFTIQPGVQYMRIAMMEEVLYFSVSEISADYLELVYVGRGNTLRFTRVE